MKDYCIRKRLKWSECHARNCCKESEYYEDMMRYLRKNLAVWLIPWFFCRCRVPCLLSWLLEVASVSVVDVSIFGFNGGFMLSLYTNLCHEGTCCRLTTNWGCGVCDSFSLTIFQKIYAASCGYLLSGITVTCFTK